MNDEVIELNFSTDHLEVLDDYDTDTLYVAIGALGEQVENITGESLEDYKQREGRMRAVIYALTTIIGRAEGFEYE